MDDVKPQGAGMYVTLNRKGEIALNRVAYNFVGAPNAFVLLFDTVNNRIGLKPAVPTARNAYPVKAYSRHGANKIRAYRLMCEFKINIPETIRFYDADTDEDNILMLDLRTARASPRALGHWSRKAKDKC